MKKIILFILLFFSLASAQQTLVRRAELQSTIKDSLDNRLGTNWVTPQMYGAVADGVTDCAAAISRSYYNPIEVLDYYYLYFPEGQYNLDSTITVPSNVHLVFSHGAILMDSIVIQGSMNDGLYKRFDAGVSLKDAKIDGVRVEWFETNTTPGTTDMSTAFKRAIASVMDTTTQRCNIVQLSSSKYLITEDNVFGSYIVANTGSRWGFGIRGVGLSSEILFTPSSGDTVYLYDGGSIVSGDTLRNALIAPTFRDFQIKCDASNVTLINLFRMGGASGFVSSNWRLENLWIDGGTTDKYGYVIKTASNVNNSESWITNCYVKYFRTLLDLRNNESVVWNISNTNAEFMRGDVVRVEGGGSVRWDGGSVFNDTDDDTYNGNDLYNFNLLRWVYGTNNASFTNVRTELRGVDSSYEARILTAALYENDADITPGVANSGVGIITFKDCDFSHLWTERVISKSEAQTRMTINFVGCYFEDDTAYDYSLFEIVDQMDSAVTYSGATDVHYGSGRGTKITFRDGWAILDTNLVFGGDSADVFTRMNIRAINCQNVSDYIVGYQEYSSVPLKVDMGASYPKYPITLKSNDNLQIRLFSNGYDLGGWTMGRGFTDYYNGSLVFNYSSYAPYVDSLGNDTDSTVTTYLTNFVDTTGFWYLHKIRTGLKYTSGAAPYQIYTTPTTTIDSTGLTTENLSASTATITDLNLNRFDTPTRENVSADSLIGRVEKLDKTLFAFGISDATGSDYSTAMFCDSAVTISKIYVVLRTDGGGNDTADVNVYWASDISGSTSTALTSDTSITNVTTGTTIASFGDATIPSGVWVWAQCNREVGTVNQINITVRGKLD